MAGGVAKVSLEMSSRRHFFRKQMAVPHHDEGAGILPT
jgi:hypothetical protein